MGSNGVPLEDLANEVTQHCHKTRTPAGAGLLTLLLIGAHLQNSKQPNISELQLSVFGMPEVAKPP